MRGWLQNSRLTFKYEREAILMSKIYGYFVSLELDL